MVKMKHCITMALVLILCVLAMPDSARADLADSLIGYWPMEEAQGSITADMSGNGNDGEINGDPGWVQGKIGGALDFDGLDDYVACGDSELLMPTDKITIQAWAYVRAFEYYDGIVSNVHDTGSDEGGYWLGTEENGYFGWGVTTNAIYYDWSGARNPVDTWYHLVATYQSGQKRLWINGQLIFDEEDMGSIDYDPLPLHGFLIGRYEDDDELHGFDGVIDEVLVWNRVLTDEEVLYLYNDGSGSPLLKILDIVPDYGATLVPRDQVLSWSLKEPMDVVAYDVYFGTDPNVEVAGYNPKVVDFELVNSHDPYGSEGEEGLLEYDTIYYWRVDTHEPNDVGTKIYPGIQLKFHTIPSTPLFNPNYPEDTLIEEDGDVVFVVDVTNPVTMDKNDMTYAWFKDDSPLSDIPDKISGSSTSMLTINDAALADEAYYYCNVTVDQTGDDLNSKEAALVIKRILGHWPFDGTLEDIVGGNHGTYLGGGSESYDAGVPELGDSSALVFSGQENRAVTVPSDAVISGFWSISFWDFSPPDILNEGYLVASGAPEGFEALLMRRWEDSWIGGLNRYVGAVGGITEEWEAEEAFGYLGPYERDQWHHHVMTHDPLTGVAAWYIDGVKAGEYIWADFTAFEPDIYIGDSDSGGRAFEGLIDDLWLYSYPLTPLEVARLYTDIMDVEICMADLEYDFSGSEGQPDCVVDIYDLAVFIDGWLECNRYAPVHCF